MKAKDLRSSGVEELEKQLLDLRKEQFNLRMQQGIGELSRPSQLRAVRRDIARIKTLMTEAKAGNGK